MADVLFQRDFTQYVNHSRYLGIVCVCVCVCVFVCVLCVRACTRMCLCVREHVCVRARMLHKCDTISCVLGIGMYNKPVKRPESPPIRDSAIIAVDRAESSEYSVVGGIECVVVRAESASCDHMLPYCHSSPAKGPHWSR